MQDSDEQMRQQAIAWAVATQDADFADWDGFVLWLEADPKHSDLYDRVLAAGDQMAALASRAAVAPPPAANDDDRIAPRPRIGRGWLYGAVAASLLAMVAVPAWQMRPQPYVVATADGARDSIVLADGSRIVLNGGTRVTLDRRNQRFARLESGEALFEVRHNARDPFVVETGGVRLVDAGTAFNVIHAAGSIDVAVSEGVVIVNPDQENVRLPAGRRARVNRTTNSVTVSDIAVDEIGGWRSGRLSFADTNLAEVAAALERGLGAPITVAPSIAARPFTGVVQISGRDAAAIAAIAPVLGTRAVRRGKGWELVDGDAAP